MKLFACPACAHVVYFDSTRCMGCGSVLGFDPESLRIRTVPAVTPSEPTSSGEASSRCCANYIEHDACNWLVPAHEMDPFCRACRLNQLIPPLDTGLVAWKRLEAAKRRLLYSLLSLHLPIVSRRDDPTRGLAFVFKAPIAGEPAMTGHADGVITINTAEADDAQRERTRVQFGEKYRSLLGHFRHESGHYYWQRLVQGTPWIEEFRRRFGDERQDYAAALAHYYDRGAVSSWTDAFVSPYASAHPWEDWAETWAHYLHITDTLETARSYGITITPRPSGGPPADTLEVRSVSLSAFDAMIASWIPLTLALNDINRAMGLLDLYPFTLSNAAIEKIGFVHRVVHASASPG